MARLWPWSSGAPAEEDHSKLEEEMSPDVNKETEAYERRERSSNEREKKDERRRDEPTAK